MKFENDYIRIVIEKKHLTIEQKEARKLKWKKRRPAVGVALLLAVSVTAGGLYAHFHAGDEVQTASVGKEAVLAEAEEEKTEEEYGSVEGDYVSTARLASGLQEKYADKNLYNYTYSDPIENVGRAEPITFELGYDVAELGLEYWTEVFAIYEDPELTYALPTSFDFNNETGIFTMKPSEFTATFSISHYGLDTETVEKYPHSQNYLYDLGAGGSWGNLGTAYLASYRDKETGELLEKPEVSIVTFLGEIEEAPKLTYSIMDDGRPAFQWNEVEGASEYMICQSYKTAENGYDGSLMVLGITNKTSWSTEPPEYGTLVTSNDIFRTFEISEDDWKDEYDYEYNLEKYGEPGVPHYDTGEYAREMGICVIAVNAEGTSMVSNICSSTELAPNLPYSTAMNAEKENGFAGFAQSYEKTEELPSYDYITMCDGYTVAKLIDYETEKAYVQDKRFVNLDENGEFINAETLACLCIPYRTEGTPFAYEITVVDYDEENLQKDKEFLEEREEKLRKKSGDVTPEFGMQFAEPDKSDLKEIRQVKEEADGNSALTEYIALNMLGGADIIDLSEFPEAKDRSFVDDAFMEAYYQNPLILGIKGYRISKKGTAIRVVYEESLEGQAKKQQEIQAKVTEVIDSIITEDMTEREKELAINQYLCDTIVYDEEALANAEENDFRYVDDSFNDSFNAYGALLNGKCVCAGYAAAFKLLAEEAGLDAIVVTGFLDGSLAHAWNKVKIDGEWQIVDVTNNDNEYFFNALLNLPSEVGDRVLVEDKEYALDKMIPEYVGESDANEYYHITDNYFPVQEVAQKLSAELEENGSVTLRTDYALNDNQFYEITDAVYGIMGDDVELYGYYWLGVIYLTMEGNVK